MTGLRLPNSAGPTDTDTVLVAQRWNTQPEKEEELRKEGFCPVAQPNFVFPTITANLLTSPDSTAYTEAYYCSVAWADYARDKLARLQMHILQLKNTMGEMERILRGVLRDDTYRQKGPKPAPKDFKDHVESDPVYSNMALQLQAQMQKELVYTAELQRYQNQVRMLSRNVELRREHWETGNSNAGQPYRNPYYPQGRPGMHRPGQ